jgi:hypothetical protein
MDIAVGDLKSNAYGLLWEPQVLEVTEEFLRNKTKDQSPSYEDLTEGEDSVLSEAKRILGRCLPPSCITGSETGLVIGYVQSGKTMSFETVISLARDNGFGMVIVFAGTKTNLREQSEDRLKKDLGIEEGENWHLFSNPNKGASSQIADKIGAWRRRPKTKRAILITVLKQINHLDNLFALLKDLPLNDLPVLIIDDESDQASLNTNAAKIRTNQVDEDTKSATYDRVCLIRSQFLAHSFLQYTATPQANLLLAHADILNPSFAELVTPGPAYTGGKAFFRDNPALIKEIPATEVPSKNNIVDSSPKSLLSALRYFLLIAAQHSLTRTKGKDKNRSMMVHPAMQTVSHKAYKTWLDRSFKALKGIILKNHTNSPAEIEKRFAVEYSSLKQTFPNILPLNTLLQEMIQEVLDDITIVEVNGTPDAEKKIDWKLSPYWIVVGGAKLDRGYTVEGLAITYMPRPLGNAAAADTLQQRARFFGYKRSYLGLCRIFVQSDVRSAFSNYVEHEEFVRAALMEHRGRPLIEWRRDFVLSALMKPTRPNVIGLDTRKITIDGWIYPKALHRDLVAVSENKKLLHKVVTDWSANFGCPVNCSIYPQFQRANSTTTVIEGVPLLNVLSEFLLTLQVKDTRDAELHSAILVSLAELKRLNSKAVVDVFLMNGLESQYRTRENARGYSRDDYNAPINQYFSLSANTINDKSYAFKDRITLQLRRFNLGTKPGDPSSANVFDVTWFSLHIPSKLKKELVVELR